MEKEEMRINNPLTIIAIFSASAEAFAAIALVQLPIEIQAIFIYFVMAFPTLIILLFFFILFFKNKVLYAPSDFEDQGHYLEVNDIKHSLNKEIDHFFKTFNDSSQSLSNEAIDLYKENIKNKIETATNRTRRDEVIEFLSNGEASTKKIFTSLGMHHQYAMLILRKLEEDGLVLRSKVAGVAGVIWKLNT
jgi:hypothetical protein